ncbi:MAG: hypothetical protein FWG07_02425 [Treponema sp.]|nr:hypothetical protein [Treponema sp.]
MKQFIVRIITLLFGLFLYALGIVLSIKANIGYAPWEVFHVGLAQKTGMSIGTAVVLTGVVVVGIVLVLGEKIGLGTLLNMVLIGVFMDLIIISNIIPEQETLTFGLLMLIIGLFIISLGSYFYIKAAFGAGPRDSLMVVLNRKAKLPIGICRSTIELSVTIIGWILGGMAGIGTIISVIAIGFFIQFTFALLKFIPSTVKHETLRQTYTNLRHSIKHTV